MGQLAHYNRRVCPKVLQGVRRQWVAATACAAALAVIAVACSEDSGSPTPPTPTPPTPPPVVANTPPVIQSITVSSPRVDTTDEIQVTSVVQDVETPLDQLTYTWSASPAIGTFTGTGAQVRWRPPTAGSPEASAMPVLYTLTLTVTERYTSAGEQKQNSASSTVQVHYNNSVAEISKLSMDFLTDFTTVLGHARAVCSQFQRQLSRQAGRAYRRSAESTAFSNTRRSILGVVGHLEQRQNVRRCGGSVHVLRHRQGDWCAGDREGNLPVDGSLRELAMVLVRQQLLLVRHDHLGRSRTAAVQPSVSGLNCACCMDGGGLPHHNQQESMSSRGPANPERSFGLSVGGVLCLIAAVLVWRGRIFRAELAGSVGVVLLVFGLVHPPLLKWPSAVWWRFARRAGLRQRARPADRAVLVLLVPLQLIWRLIGKDPLARRRDQ